MKPFETKRRKSLLITGAVIGLLIICFFVFKRCSVDQQQVSTYLKQNALILDVRTTTEFDRGHIPGAVNVSLGKLRTEKLKFSKDQRIITCCSHGLRSVKAMGILNSRGYKHVVNGGAWTDLERCMGSN
mgnify:CR=1 FL=1